MTMIRTKSLSAATLALLFLAACGTGGGMGDILGGGGSNRDLELRGTVDYVDRNSRSVYLTNVSGYNSSMLSSGGRDSVRVYYDDRTPVSWQGQNYRVEDLERGDEVRVRVDESGNQLVAQSMTVTHNVASGGGGSYPSYPSGSGSSNPSYGSNIRGTVRYIDTSRRTIELDRGNGSLMYIEYETNTPVHFNNQTYRTTDLERGDEIEVRFRDLGGNRFVAQDVTVLRSVSGTNSGGTWGGPQGSSQSSNYSTVRGTVRSVDTSRRTIELESVSWTRNNFNRNGGGTSGSRIIVSYDANTSVDVSGRLHPVSGLERGDVVDVQVSNPNASTPFAQRIILVRDVNNR